MNVLYNVDENQICLAGTVSCVEFLLKPQGVTVTTTGSGIMPLTWSDWDRVVKHVEKHRPQNDKKGPDYACLHEAKRILALVSPDEKPLPSLLGVLTQISKVVTNLHVRLGAAECQVGGLKQQVNHLNMLAFPFCPECRTPMELIDGHDPVTGLNTVKRSCPKCKAGGRA